MYAGSGLKHDIDEIREGLNEMYEDFQRLNESLDRIGDGVDSQLSTIKQMLNQESPYQPLLIH